MPVLDIATCSVVKNLKGSLKQPSDLFAYAILNVAAFFTMWHGETVLLPAVLDGYPITVKAFHHSFAIWLYLGVVINLHMIRIRHSSIRYRVLTPPDSKGRQFGTPGSDADTTEDVLVYRRSTEFKDELRHIAEQFTRQPYDSADTWHICASCETFVPPRSWHCFICQTCVLRRDHHCIFARSCVGEDNHCNFLGLLVYLTAGTFYSSVVTFVDVVLIQKIAWWSWFAKSLLAVYTVFFDFSTYYLIATINFTGCMAATGTCVYYFILAAKGQTSADNCRKVSRKVTGISGLSYRNFRKFVGPHPVYRILWPFHKVTYNKYGNQKPSDFVKVR